VVHSDAISLPNWSRPAGTNNIETSARLHAGSARPDRNEPTDGNPGCYEDIDHADTFVLWGVNLAESHPVLFSRLLERRRRHPAARIIELSPRTTRTSYVCDQSLLFAPHAAGAVANGICRELVERKLVRRDFVDRYVSFKLGRLADPPEPGGRAGPETDRRELTEYVVSVGVRRAGWRSSGCLPRLPAGWPRSTAIRRAGCPSGIELNAEEKEPPSTPCSTTFTW
jgi:anaerobic selenocysteine-containing dehydrogenase